MNMYCKGQKVLSEQGRVNWDCIFQGQLLITMYKGKQLKPEGVGIDPGEFVQSGASSRSNFDQFPEENPGA